MDDWITLRYSLRLQGAVFLKTILRGRKGPRGPLENAIKQGRTHVRHHGWIVVRVQEQSADEMSGREDDPGDAGVPEPDGQKSVGHVDEETDRQSGSERPSCLEVLRPVIHGITGLSTRVVQPRQVHTQGDLKGQQGHQHRAAHSREPDLVHAWPGDGRHQNCKQKESRSRSTKRHFSALMVRESAASFPSAPY